MPARAAFACASATVVLAAGVRLEFRRTARLAATAAAAYFALVVATGAGVILRHASEYGAYSGVAEQLAL